ncbi:hypothetical protein HWV62_29140 [Athelia sp. TMB]|nr:hypothetical protein HWV62_29140 [Athelia sp. TMB]
MSNPNFDADLTREEIVKKLASLSALLKHRDELETTAGTLHNQDQQGHSNNSDDRLPDAIYDPFDDVYRCSECNAEVVDERCHRCGEKHQWVDDFRQGMARNIDNLSTDNQAMRGERQLAPRGITPFDEIGDPNIQRNYLGRTKEYLELLRRGATREMCKTFHLEFKKETGIVAWADQVLFDSMSGPAMLEGHLWKIYLGRRIQLDDDDLDGSEFIEDLLEDAILFPLRSSRCSARVQERWETIQETPGVWATRPMHNLLEDTDDDSDEPDLNDSSEDSCDEHPEPGEGRMQDEALEPGAAPFRWDHNPAIASEEYEIDPVSAMDVFDDSGSESDFDPSAPPREYIDRYDIVVESDASNHGVPGRVSASGDHEQGSEMIAVSDVTFADSDNSADSDFDSDEVLSGDEVALEEVRAWQAGGWPKSCTAAA